MGRSWARIGIGLVQLVMARAQRVGIDEETDKVERGCAADIEG